MEDRKKEEKKVWYEIEKAFTNHRSADFKIVQEYPVHSPEELFVVREDVREDYKKQLLLPDTEYYKLFSFMRVGKNPTVWTRLFLVEDGPDGYNRHQILGSDLSEEDEGSKTELTLLQNSRKLINQKIVFSDEDYDKADQIVEVLNFVEYKYMVQWRPVGEERRFTQSFIHHDLLHSRSRAINFFKGKISSGHECWLSLTKISGPFSALDIGSTITGWSREIQEGRIGEHEILKSLGYEHPDPGYSQFTPRTDELYSQ